VARRIFHTFHFKRDSWRVQQVRQMGVIEGQQLLSPNEWEAVKRSGDAAIRKWINDQMSGKSAVVVLIGRQTAGRKWVNYEIKKAWDDGRGLVGVYIHSLRNENQQQDSRGANPFSGFSVGTTPLSSIVKAYDPPSTDSSRAYAYIKSNLERWIEEAITIRKRH
jgi:antiphage defense system Thoeris ThsB-like protein